MLLIRLMRHASSGSLNSCFSSSSQKSAVLYIAAFPCIPNCRGIMSQLITGDYVIKFERKSFRVQPSARGIAICFASAQPKAQVRGGKRRYGLSLSLSAV